MKKNTLYYCFTATITLQNLQQSDDNNWTGTVELQYLHCTKFCTSLAQTKATAHVRAHPVGASGSLDMLSPFFSQIVGPHSKPLLVEINLKLYLGLYAKLHLNVVM